MFKTFEKEVIEEKIVKIKVKVKRKLRSCYCEICEEHIATEQHRNQFKNSIYLMNQCRWCNHTFCNKHFIKSKSYCHNCFDKHIKPFTDRRINMLKQFNKIKKSCPQNIILESYKFRKEYKILQAEFNLYAAKRRKNNSYYLTF